jgi:hypothetical protein
VVYQSSVLGFHVYNFAHVLMTVFDNQQITHPNAGEEEHSVQETVWYRQVFGSEECVSIMEL